KRCGQPFMADICGANVLTPHRKRCGQPFMADICGANVLTLCFPSPSAFFKREKTDFSENFPISEILFFSSVLWFFLQKKYNIIFRR
ncbi:hypothetical protein, partial [Anaerotignum lactatifermentans]|uniref:hypothetical protein n=1 Tax=Anaerotignum lactatifermentans TaxID=160404 RepID=UPI0027BB0823